MKKRKIIAFLLAFILLMQLLCIGVMAEELEDAPDESEAVEEVEEEEIPEEPELEPAPELVCKGAILMELNSGSTVYEFHADDRLYPASLTKIMTCLLALEKGNLSDEITVDGALLEGLDEDASVAGLVDGEKLTLEELLYCVMVPSANDASIVVADHIAGSVDAFVDMMNDKAAELGCRDTHFMNPDGLHDENHYTTARDMAIITKAALESETFRTMCATSTHELPANNISDSRMLYTTNYFLSTIISTKYYWEKVSGVKTGFTTPAGRCLVTLVEEGSFSYLSVVLGAETPYDENGEPVYGSFTESRKLLEYGLDNFAFASVLSHLNPVAQVPVQGGKVGSVVIAPADDINALLPANYNEDKIAVSYELTNADGLTAPLAANEVVGTVTVTYDGKPVGQTDARTIAAVERRTILSTPQDDDSGVLRLIPILIIILAVILLLIAWLNRRAGRRRRKKRK